MSVWTKKRTCCRLIASLFLLGLIHVQAAVRLPIQFSIETHDPPLRVTAARALLKSNWIGILNNLHKKRWQRSYDGEKNHLFPWPDFPITFCGSGAMPCCTWCRLISAHQLIHLCRTHHTFHLPRGVSFTTAHRALHPVERKRIEWIFAIFTIASKQFYNAVTHRTPWCHIPFGCGAHLFSACFGFWYEWWLFHVLTVSFAYMLATFACLWPLVMISCK